MQLVPQRMTLQPAVSGGVELDVAGLGELGVRLDAQPRHAVLKERIIERTYYYLHQSSPGVSPSDNSCPFLCAAQLLCTGRRLLQKTYGIFTNFLLKFVKSQARATGGGLTHAT